MQPESHNRAAREQPGRSQGAVRGSQASSHGAAREQPDSRMGASVDQPGSRQGSQGAASEQPAGENMQQSYKLHCHYEVAYILNHKNHDFCFIRAYHYFWGISDAME